MVLQDADFGLNLKRNFVLAEYNLKLKLTACRVPHLTKPQNDSCYCKDVSAKITKVVFKRKKKMIYIFLTVCILAVYLLTLHREKHKSIYIMSYSTETVANYFIKKHSEDGQLTPMKLLKLVYISYGWYLVTFNSKKLVGENPVAWKHGPVFPFLYSKLKDYGKSFVKEPIYSYKSEEISEEDALFLDKIWNIYGEKDGIYLSALTHQEDTPWSLTYPRGENITIPDELIEKHYKEMAS